MSLSQALPQRKPRNEKRTAQCLEPPPSDGIYGNNVMVHSIMLLAGYQVDVELIDNSVWTGVLRTISPEMAIVLSVAHLRRNTSNEQCLLASHDAIRPHLVIPFGEIVTISASDVDIPTIKTVFKTDSEIGVLNGLTDRDLKPFFGDEDQNDVGISTRMENQRDGGWSADEMLSTNKKIFGVKSTYTDDLHGYTTQLELSDTPQDMLRQKRAEQLAQEIEERNFNEGDDGVTEEDKFSSVVRPNNALHTPTIQTHVASTQRQQDSGFSEQLCVTNNNNNPSTPTQQPSLDVQPPNEENVEGDTLEELQNFSENFKLMLTEDQQQEESCEHGSPPIAPDGKDVKVIEFKLNPQAQEFSPFPSVNQSNSPAVSPVSTMPYVSGRRGSRGGRGSQYQVHGQYQPALLPTVADYHVQQQPYIAASSYPASQMMPVYQTVSQPQQVTSPRTQRLLQSPQMFQSGTPYYDGYTQVMVSHPQQAALMPQLPGNRQTMVAPAATSTQPFYLISQGTGTLPHTPTNVAFQAGQFVSSPQMSGVQYMSPYQQMM